MALRTNPASLSYAYQDKRDRTIHCEIAFTACDDDPSVGWVGYVAFQGCFVTEVVLYDGERVKTSDPAWWLPLDDHAAAHCDQADDWQDLARQQWNETR